MNKFLLLIAALIVHVAAPTTTNAQSLFYEGCPPGKSAEFEDSSMIVFVASDGSNIPGLTCRDVRNIVEATQVLGMALMPVSVALRSPAVAAQIGETLAVYGLTLANPAVLGVTVLGAFGVVTVYFVMKQSLDACEKQNQEKLRQEILSNLKESFRVNGVSPKLEYHR